MFQNSTFPSAVDLPQNLPHAQPLRALRRLAHVLPLPQGARDYLIWTLIMLAVTGMVLLQVLLSMQITQTELILDDLGLEYTQIEQENAELLWQISQFTHLERIETEARRMGYGPGLNPEYRWVDSSQGTPTAAVQTSDGLSTEAGSSGVGQTAAPNETDWGNAVDEWFTRSWQRVQTWWQPNDVPIGLMWQRWTEDRF